MYYLKVKEAIESTYTDGIDYYSIHETDVGIDNADDKDIFESDNIKKALIYFGLQLTEETIMGTLVFNSENAINRAFELLGIRAYDLGAYHFMICDSIRKKAFAILKYNLNNLKALGKITQGDYTAVYNALKEQNIDLNIL